MDILLGLVITVFVFLLLLFAAVRDYQTREVSNWVWLVGLFCLPFTIFRVGVAGLLLQYGLQVLLVFIIILVGFQRGVLGGADGKAVLIISLLYPWIILDPLWLVIAPAIVLIGGFLLVGLHSLWLLCRNLFTWKQVSKTQDGIQKPEKKTYWLSRHFSVQSTQGTQWKQVDVPLIIYFFIIYTMLLILTSMLL